MLPNKICLIRFTIEKEGQIVRFSQTLPNNLLTCTGIKISTGYLHWGYYPAIHSFGFTAIEFDKKECFNIPVLSGWNQCENRAYFPVLVNLDNTLVTGYYQDRNDTPGYPYEVSIYLQCTLKEPKL